jgi:hypothetical protein
VNVPVPLVLQVTVPVGVSGVPGEESVTLAVQNILPLIELLIFDEQLIVVEVARIVTVRLVLLEPLS